MKMLDLFCGVGGASMGYYRAGFEVIGVDISPQPDYPFEFIQGNALEIPLEGFDAIHASPPCQKFSDLAKRNKNGDSWPDFIDPIRQRLINTGKPYIIENVEGAPLVNPIRLCGTSFPELRVIRHRIFETNFYVSEPVHQKHPLVFTFDKRKNHYGKLNQSIAFVQVTGGGNSTFKNAKDAMNIPWAKIKKSLNEAIPPAYTEYIGTELLIQILRKDWKGDLNA